ncbi:MAG: Crp/Fnr family transcriptional regulator [Burkholderiales bacterium]|nr:Crp/Fnr family transcriptional regulator [Burkholderiales bacterium]
MKGRATSPAEGVRLLSRIGWLSETSADFQKRLWAAAIWRELPAGKVFNRAGDRDAGMWGIASGQINLTSGLSVGDSPVADVWLPGHWGGFGPILSGFRAANAEPAVASLLALVPYAAFTQMLDERPAWWRFVGRLSARYTFRFAGAAGDLLIPDPRLRLIAVLLRLADCRHRDSELGMPIVLRLTQLQLAQCANVSRQLVGPLLHDLQAQDSITVGYRELTMRKTAALRRQLDAS